MPSSVISSAQSQVTLRRVVKAGRSGLVQRPQFANCAAYAAMGFSKQQMPTGMSSRSQVVMVRFSLRSSWWWRSVFGVGGIEFRWVVRC